MDDLAKLINRLEGSKTLMQIAARNGARKAGLLVEGDAKRLCPVDTGRLRSSISTETEDTAEGAKAFVSTNAEYAPFVEYGTGERGDPSVYHAVEVELKKTGKVVKWLGNPPHPFLRPALAMNRDSGNIQKVFADEVGKVFR